MSNAFIDLYKMMQQAGESVMPPDVAVGVVKSLSPLQVVVGDTMLTRGLYAPPGLLRTDPVPEAPPGSFSACGSCTGDGRITGSCGKHWAAEVAALRAFVAQEAATSRLAVGDMVAIKRLGELNLILCKVVAV